MLAAEYTARPATASPQGRRRQTMGLTAVFSRLRGLARGPVFARMGLVGLAFALPFELTRPLANVGPLALSSVELFLYVAVGLFALSVASRQARPFARGLARHAAPLTWAAVVALSALRAPVEPQSALKFALRSLGGVTLYFAAATLLRPPGAALAASVALALGGGLAALLVWAEVRVPGAAAMLSPFHDRTFEVLGLPRASGPFQYPNIAAMYLEAALPVVLALGAALDARARARDGGGASAGSLSFFRRHRYALIGTAGAVWLGSGVWLTASRAGIGTAAVILAALAAAGLWPRGVGRQGDEAGARRALGWQALGALGGLAVVALLLMPSSPLLGLRMQYWRDPAWYQAALTVVEGARPLPSALRPGERASVALRIQNRGAVVWPKSGENRVAVSYHWKDRDSDEMALFDGLRTALPGDLRPGEAATVIARIEAPPLPGRYLLMLDLVHEGVTWFGDRGNPGLVIEIEVSAQAVPTPSAAIAISAPVGDQAAALAVPSRTSLWRAAVAAWRDHPLLGLGPDNFRLVYGRYLGLADADERFHANSLYFETLASLGLLGVAALAFLVLGFARVARRLIGGPDSNPAARLLATGVAAGLLAFLVHGFLDYFLEFTPTYGLAWLLAGMLVALDGREPGRESDKE